MFQLIQPFNKVVFDISVYIKIWSCLISECIMISVCVKSLLSVVSKSWMTVGVANFMHCLIY